MKYESYNVFDAFQNDDSIWEIDEHEIFKQVRNDYEIDKNEFENTDFVDENVNLRIFEFSKKENDSDDESDDDDEMKINDEKINDEKIDNQKIIEISNDE